MPTKRLYLRHGARYIAYAAAFGVLFGGCNALVASFLDYDAFIDSFSDRDPLATSFSDSDFPDGFFLTPLKKSDGVRKPDRFGS
jgi:hypothetical protein